MWRIKPRICYYYGVLTAQYTSYADYIGHTYLDLPITDKVQLSVFYLQPRPDSPNAYTEGLSGGAWPCILVQSSAPARTA